MQIKDVESIKDVFFKNVRHTMIICIDNN